MNKSRKEKLLRLYIQNSIIGTYNTLVLVGVLLFARFYLYGSPSEAEYIGGIVLGSLAIFFLKTQNDHYQATLKKKELDPVQYRKALIKIMLYKAGYMLPWLAIIYWPLQTDDTYKHFLGFAFTLSAISLYASTSS